MGLLDFLRRKPVETKAIEPVVREPVVRVDSWVNPYAGYGTSRDKIQAAYHDWSPILSVLELESLYYNNDLAAAIVDALPEEVFRKGVEYENGGDLSDLVQDAFDRLSLLNRCEEAMTWARLYGGAAVILGVDDGQTMDQPVRVEAVRDIKYAIVIDKRFTYPLTTYVDPLAATIGQPQTYQIVMPVAGTPLGASPSNSGTVVHESRMIRFDGTRVDVINRQRNGGWSYSVLQRVYDTLRRFSQAVDASSQLAIDAGQAVFSIENWIAAMSGPNSSAAVARMATVDQQRSAGRAIVLDANKEKFERQPVNVTGVPDLLDRFMVLVSAAARIPVTKLFGRSPAGLNATGESDLTQWYDYVESTQMRTAPDLNRVATLITAGAWEGEICFRPLRTPSAKDEADADQARANVWKTYVDMGAVMPEEVRLAVFADEGIEVDVDAERAAIDAERSLASSVDPTSPPAPPSSGQLPEDETGEDGEEESPPSSRRAPPAE